MARPPHNGPTDRELTLLKLLWRDGPSTVKHLHSVFPLRPKPAYTSLQTNLQGMLEKRYVTRQADQQAHIYAPALSQAEVERGAVHDLIRRVFDGSALRLFTTALTDEQASAEELSQLQALLNDRRD
ncbi:BlaI/MecI/CopY family transcriptional regulator [Deinococcus sp. HMF7620]|uniref:BlaI/MecI/CopY family transcriptional regulator n=1 Tax=Deinococcus arboris TaxID=2682977 RepID=A0A7C9LQB9_9DEIO|nr:BlaI/MecI/CopY family transcriptional regulator [Deinococcus arboris]MVN89457.1 BlaI/MecI/CopY family transcriptional regulator [Deinococcus arboris]